MLEKIDLSKSPPTVACLFCFKNRIYFELHQHKIIEEQYPLDLIHHYIFGYYLQSCSEAKYYMTFVDNYDKMSEIVSFSVKAEYSQLLTYFENVTNMEKYVFDAFRQIARENMTLTFFKNIAVRIVSYEKLLSLKTHK